MATGCASPHVAKNPPSPAASSTSDMSVLVEALPKDDRTQLAAVLEQCPIVALPKGASRLALRMPTASLFVVEEGTAAVSRLPGPGNRQIAVALRRAGGILLPLEEDECVFALTDTWLTALTPAAIAALVA